MLISESPTMETQTLISKATSNNIVASSHVRLYLNYRLHTTPFHTLYLYLSPFPCIILTYVSKAILSVGNRFEKCYTSGGEYVIHCSDAMLACRLVSTGWAYDVVDLVSTLRRYAVEGRTDSTNILKHHDNRIENLSSSEKSIGVFLTLDLVGSYYVQPSVVWHFCSRFDK